MPVTPSGDAVPRGKLRSVVTYLEMHAPPWGDGVPPDIRPPGPDIRVESAPSVSVPFYRSLYDSVGEAWLWWERRVMSDADLAAAISDPAVEIRVLSAGDAVAGYSELDRRRIGEVEIAYFGLTPAFIGRGVGQYLMEATLHAAWTKETKRVWVHTCTEDHPGALAFYRRSGFRAYRTDEVLIDDPRLSGHFPSHRAS